METQIETLEKALKDINHPLRKGYREYLIEFRKEALTGDPLNFFEWVRDFGGWYK